MHIYTNVKKSAHIHRYKQTHASNAGIAYSVYLVPAGFMLGLPLLLQLGS
jgi:hypothetical protein